MEEQIDTNIAPIMTFKDVSSIKITKEMIPEPWFLSHYLDFTDPEHIYGKPLNFELKLKLGVTLFFENINVARTIFEVFTLDFENMDLKKEYPEIFI